jgi:hypothetical protein
MQQENLSCFGSIYVQQLLQVYEAFLQNPKCENTDDDIYMSASDKTCTLLYFLDMSSNYAICNETK